MRSERGQASVEWIVLVLLLALALAALARSGLRADAGDLGAELLSTLTCAARGGCHAKRDGPRAGGAARPGEAPRSGAMPAAGAPSRLVTAPPLLPLAPGRDGVARPGGGGLAPRRPPAVRSPLAPRARPWLRPPRFMAPLVRRAGHGAGVLWRRSWMICLGYERVRYSVLHPEIRFPNAAIPMSEGVRIANDCLSPVDLIRDFGRPSKP
jgi:hypothetical protein